MFFAVCFFDIRWLGFPWELGMNLAGTINMWYECADSGGCIVVGGTGNADVA